ncbi:MAG TPA: hypothetical protein VGF93_20590 [Solirubrobacteraceae bacterium]
MSSASGPALRTLAFGDLEPSVWGVAWFPEPGQPGFVAIGTARSSATREATLTADDESGEWRLHGDGVELTASPGDAPLVGAGDDFDQLCRVRGSVDIVDPVGGSEQREVDCLGRRAVHAATDRLDRFESIRDVSAWFDDSHGLAVVALRPRKSRGQESDHVTAAALEPETTPPVTDPRMSTVYAADGHPLRVGLELWLGEDEDEQFPRRASGETVGVAATGHTGLFDVSAQFVHWRGRAGDGGGVYLLARRG